MLGLAALRTESAHSRGSSCSQQQALPGSPGKDFSLALRTLLARQASEGLPACVEGKSASIASSSDAVSCTCTIKCLAKNGCLRWTVD